ncbi:Developmental regulatory protein wetA [Trichoderma lentiforme]|uniref:Developmental regulatory protein wetA n=1 Tax=Trichoderma lentiforme TaxID=1567552 RepID=A0A9P4XS37_9HYPO|nr:Developmental regulatory protein wetA [Trichoderma lentiforme]
MAFWTAQFRVEPTVDREASMYWQGTDGLPSDASSDLFGQFVDFDGDSVARTPVDDGRGGSSTIGTVPPDSFFMNQAATGTASSVVSSADEFDFFSTTSHLGPTTSAASHGLDSQELAFGVAADPATGGTRPINHLSRKSMSETELQRLENISLYSPQKNTSSVSHPPSPTPPNTSIRRPKKLVEALSSTIRKATNLGRRTRKQQPQQQQQQQQQQPPIIERSASPTLDHPPMAIKSRAARMHSIAQSSVSSVSHESPSPTSYDHGASGFIHGFCDDPFAEAPRSYQSPSMQYYNQGGMDPTPIHSSNRRIKSEQHLYQAASNMIGSTATIDTASQASQHGWQQQMMAASGPEPWGSTDYAASQDSAWWDLNINASMNQAMHSQHGELPYEYAPIPDTGGAGLMIHMPQPRGPQPAVVNDIGLNSQTYLPPPPPIPTDRCSRPPRAPSSGARHRNLSSSPMRKTRGPSASPTPAHAQMRNQSRHSSTGSISSVRSASGRGPGSAPNTPGGVRKRRSRDAGAGGGGISLGGDGIGFVNFTPNDGSILMTGVAPSGSSKTKARREKEAQEKRRRLSEAAMKAVAAAGGDVDKLIQEGFVF